MTQALRDSGWLGSSGRCPSALTWADGGSFSDATTGAYLTFADDGNGNTVVAVDIDGAGAGTPVTLAILPGVDPTHALSLLNDNFTPG